MNKKLYLHQVVLNTLIKESINGESFRCLFTQ